MRGRVVEILDRQSVWDIAIQETGSVEGLFGLMAENPDKMNLSQLPQAGISFNTNSNPSDTTVKTYFDNNKLKPAFSANTTDLGVGGSYSNDYGNDYN